MSNGTGAFDGFDDIIQGNAGIFGSDVPAMENGLTAFDSTRTVPQRDGVHVEMHCRKCGAPVRITVEWGEIVAVRYNVPAHVAYQGTTGFVGEPTSWGFSPEQQAWFPNSSKCPSGRGCSESCAPFFKPEEAEKHLAVARRNQWFPPKWESAASTVCENARIRMSQRR